MPRTLRVIPLAAGIACIALAAGADEFRRAGFPAPDSHPHLRDTARPSGARWPVVSVPRPPGPGPAPRTPAPFVPHFGVSLDSSGVRPFVDGVYFSPAEGVEVTARTSLSDGFRGMLGVTLRF